MNQEKCQVGQNDRKHGKEKTNSMKLRNRKEKEHLSKDWGGGKEKQSYLYTCLEHFLVLCVLNDVFNPEVELEPRTQSCVRCGLRPVLGNENLR
jgi:hypothetical protein